MIDTTKKNNNLNIVIMIIVDLEKVNNNIYELSKFLNIDKLDDINQIQEIKINNNIKYTFNDNIIEYDDFNKCVYIEFALKNHNIKAYKNDLLQMEMTINLGKEMNKNKIIKFANHNYCCVYVEFNIIKQMIYDSFDIKTTSCTSKHLLNCLPTRLSNDGCILYDKYIDEANKLYERYEIFFEQIKKCLQSNVFDKIFNKQKRETLNKINPKQITAEKYISNIKAALDYFVLIDEQCIHEDMVEYILKMNIIFNEYMFDINNFQKCYELNIKNMIEKYSLFEEYINKFKQYVRIFFIQNTSEDESIENIIFDFESFKNVIDYLMKELHKIKIQYVSNFKEYDLQNTKIKNVFTDINELLKNNKLEIIDLEKYLKVFKEKYSDVKSNEEIGKLIQRRYTLNQ